MAFTGHVRTQVPQAVHRRSSIVGWKALGCITGMPFCAERALDAATGAAAADVAQLPLDVVRDVHEAVLPGGLEEFASLLPADLPGVTVPDDVAGRDPKAHARLQGVVARRTEVGRHMAAEAVGDGQGVGLLHIRGGAVPVEDLRREVVVERGLLHEGATDERGDSGDIRVERAVAGHVGIVGLGQTLLRQSIVQAHHGEARSSPPQEARACTSSRRSGRRAGRGRGPCLPSPRAGRGERPRLCRYAGQGPQEW